MPWRATNPASAIHIRPSQHPVIYLKWACLMTRGMWRLSIWLWKKKKCTALFKISSLDIMYVTGEMTFISSSTDRTCYHGNLPQFLHCKLHNNMQRITTRYSQTRSFIICILYTIWSSNSQPVMKTKGLLSCSKMPATGPWTNFPTND